MPKAVVRVRPITARAENNGAQLIQVNTFFGLTRFNLPYAPVEVSYTDMSNNFEEYKRPGDFSILDTTGPRNLKVQMQFRFADAPSRGFDSIEGELNRLRLIGLDQGPVWFVNLDAYLSRPIAPSFDIFYNNVSIRLALFRIQELSVTVMRRNKYNEATQADISLSLIEDRNPLVADVLLPPIVYDEVPQRAGVDSSPGGTLDGITYTDSTGQTTPKPKSTT